MALADRVAGQVAERQAVRAADPVTMEEFGYLLGRGQGGGMTKAGVSVGPTRALGVSAWHRGVRYLTETVASLPVRTFSDLGGKRTRRADPPWMARPDTELPWFGLIEQWMMSELHRGNAYSFKVRNPMGQVIGLRPVHPDRVRGGQAADGTKVFKIDNRDDVGFTSREVFHIPGLSYNGIYGLDPLSLMAEGIGRAAAADQFAAKSFGQGSHLQAYLSFKEPLTEDEANATKNQWLRFHSGMSNGDQFGVLGNGAEYNTVTLTPEQQQLLETRKFEVTEVARFLGVVPHKLYDLEHATFSNIEHQAIEAVVDGVRPWVERFESWINFDPHLLPAGNFVEFQLDGLLRGDSAARAAFYTAGVNGGWMTRAEPRSLENMPEIEGLDKVLVPLNMRQAGDEEPMKERVENTGALVRAGYDPVEAAAAMGVPTIKHTGLAPVTVQSRPPKTTDEVTA